MQTDTAQTVVKFYLVSKGEDIFKGDIVAFFPEEKYNDYLPNTFLSYSEIGQHGPCHIYFIKEYCRRAKPAEYADLKAELESIGYNLKIK